MKSLFSKTTKNLTKEAIQTAKEEVVENVKKIPEKVKGILIGIGIALCAVLVSKLTRSNQTPAVSVIVVK